jgi:hypothetical protein
MPGFEINNAISKDLEQYLDLDSKELKIYLGLLSLGNTATLGQISLITGFDIIITGSALESLTHKGYVSQFKGTISRYMALEPFLESFTKLFDPIAFAGVIRKISKSLEETPFGLIDDAKMFNKYLTETLTEKKKEILKDKKLSEELETLLNESIKIISYTAFSIIQDMEKKGKKIQVKASKSFQRETDAIFKSISDSRTNLTNLLRISREIKTPALLLHDVLVGESSILITLRDIITRARKSLFIFMVQPEIKSLMKLIELSQRYDIKIEVVGNLNNTPPSILEKVRNDGVGINLRQLHEIDFWGVVMDEQELLFAPVTKNKEDYEEITGIFTTYIPLIKVFSEQLRKLVMRAQPMDV